MNSKLMEVIEIKTSSFLLTLLFFKPSKYG